MTLSPAHQAAISSYTGHVTVCPPHTYSWQLGSELVKKSHLSRTHDKMRERGNSTTRLVMASIHAGHSPEETARTLGVSISCVKAHMSKRASKPKSHLAITRWVGYFSVKQEY